MNLYQSNPGDPAVSGYTPLSYDITALAAANLGQTLQLRFAEVDNQLFFQAGVDAVSIDVIADTPEPGSVTLLAAGLLIFLLAGGKKGLIFGLARGTLPVGVRSVVKK